MIGDWPVVLDLFNFLPESIWDLTVWLIVCIDWILPICSDSTRDWRNTEITRCKINLHAEASILLWAFLYARRGTKFWQLNRSWYYWLEFLVFILTWKVTCGFDFAYRLVGISALTQPDPNRTLSDIIGLDSPSQFLSPSNKQGNLFRSYFPLYRATVALEDPASLWRIYNQPTQREILVTCGSRSPPYLLHLFEGLPIWIIASLYWMGIQIHSLQPWHPCEINFPIS